MTSNISNPRGNHVSPRVYFNETVAWKKEGRRIQGSSDGNMEYKVFPSTNPYIVVTPKLLEASYASGTVCFDFEYKDIIGNIAVVVYDKFNIIDGNPSITSGGSSGTCCITLKDNTELHEKICYVTLTNFIVSGTCVIEQKKIPSIEIEDLGKVPFDGLEKCLAIEYDGDGTLTASVKTGNVNIAKIDNNMICLKFNENTSSDEAPFDIEIGDGSVSSNITGTQGVNSAISIDPSTDIEHPYSGGTSAVSVTSYIDNVTYEASMPWVKITKGTGNVYNIATERNNGSIRMATVTFSNGINEATIDVVQSPIPVIQFTTDRIDIFATTPSFTATANLSNMINPVASDFEITPSSSLPWINISIESVNLKRISLKCTVQPNTDVDNIRTLTIGLNLKNDKLIKSSFVLTQAKAELREIGITFNETTIPFTGGTVTADVSLTNITPTDVAFKFSNSSMISSSAWAGTSLTLVIKSNTSDATSILTVTAYSKTYSIQATDTLAQQYAFIAFGQPSQILPPLSVTMVNEIVGEYPSGINVILTPDTSTLYTEISDLDAAGQFEYHTTANDTKAERKGTIKAYLEGYESISAVCTLTQPPLTLSLGETGSTVGPKGTSITTQVYIAADTTYRDLSYSGESGLMCTLDLTSGQLTITVSPNIDSTVRELTATVWYTEASSVEATYKVTQNAPWIISYTTSDDTSKPTLDMVLVENKRGTQIEANVDTYGKVILYDEPVTVRKLFSGMTVLTSVDFPLSVTKLYGSPCSNCSNLTSVTFNGGATNNLTEVGGFNGCTSLKNVGFLEQAPNLKTIRMIGFKNCRSITSVTLPSSVETIELGAFSNCVAMTAFTANEGLKTIDPEVFDTCSALTSFFIPSSVQSLGDLVFTRCFSLTSLTLNDKLTKIPSMMCQYCTSLPKIDLRNCVAIGKYAFYSCTTLASVTGINYITSIEDAGFGCCASLPNVSLTTALTGLSTRAFYECRAFTSINIPESITVIPSYAFSGCSSVTSITIPNSVERIETGAFNRLSNSFTSVTIPPNVVEIGELAFSDNTLKEIHMKPSSAPTAYSTTFECDLAGGTLYVPNGSTTYNIWIDQGYIPNTWDIVYE